ncbi:serine/threonine-protein kinase [Geodermatophilus sp. SYSU D00691]
MQPLLQQGVEVSRYRVEDLVARGGMGLVYRARDVRLDRPVALKVLSPDLSDDERFRERFVRESRLAAAVEHPHIIPIYEADEWQGLLYLAMRFIHGADLHTVLATRGPLDVATTLFVLQQAASALDAAHSAGLVHRDVKPANLVMSGATAERVPPDVHVYLTDFGLTKKTSSASGITTTGQFLGTLNYVAPEQIRGDDVDSRADVYALACVTTEMLTGEPPFVRDTDAALLWAHINAPPPSLAARRADLPPTVDGVIAHGMAKERADRPESCGAFVALLRAATQTPMGPVSSPPDDPPVVLRGPLPDPRPGHPSFPSGARSVPVPVPPGPPVVPDPRAPSTIRHDPALGPPVEAAGPRGPTRPAPARRRSGRAWWWVAAALLLAVVAVLALVWRPWAADPPLERQLVEGFTARVPADWQRFAEPDSADDVVLSTRDWRPLFVEDDSTAAATAAHDDPDSVVGVYADTDDRLNSDSPSQQVELVAAALPGASLANDGTTEVAGQEFASFSGTMALGDVEELHVRGVVALAEPRLLLVFFAPHSVADEWRPTFQQVLDSVRAEG